MRVAGNALAVDFHAEVVELAFADAAFQEAAGVDARRAVALDVEDVARVVFAGGAPEVVEADVVQRGARGEAGDVAAEVAGLAVGAHDRGHGVPADDAADAPLHRGVAVALGFQVRRDGVDVFGGGLERQVGAGAAGQFDHALQQVVGALGAVGVEHGLHGFDPLAGFGGVEVVFQRVGQPVHSVFLRPAIGRGQVVLESRLGV